MSENILHYIYDPLCGWCYAANPMVLAAASSGVRVVLHGGALWGQPTRLDAKRRDDIRHHDARIAALSGLPFDAAYVHGVLGDADTVFWSRPTIAGVLAAGEMRAGAELEMLNAIQTAHYVSGRRVTEEATLTALALSIDIPPQGFAAAMRDSPVDAHVAQTRRLMAAANVRGFPTFLLQIGETRAPVPHEPHYADPNGLLGAIREVAASVAVSGMSQT